MVKKLSNTQMKLVSGGYIFYAGHNAGDYSKPWEVIDDATGAVLGRYANRCEAVYMAGIKMQTEMEITSFGELERLRKASKSSTENRYSQDFCTRCN